MLYNAQYDKLALSNIITVILSYLDLLYANLAIFLNWIEKDSRETYVSL